MPKPDSDADDNKNVEDDPKDPKEVSGIPPTLDQVHSMSQAKVEEEDADEASNTDDDNDADDPDGAAGTKKPAVVDDGESGDEEVPEDDAEGEDDATVDLDAGGAGDSVPVVPDAVTPPVADKAAPELDADTAKPGAGKIAIKDAEGKTFYFNNRDEMPEDFEPENYKALMNAASLFAKKEIADEAAAADAEAKAKADAEVAETKARTDAMQAEWERDADDLSSAGFLPKEPKKLEAAKSEVYTYIEDELKKGNVISNFKQAYKSMMYDKEQAKKEADQKKIDQAKKDRGAIVQSGSSSGAPSGGSTRGKVLEAPPSGVGLDAVHNRAIEQLG